MTVIEEPSSMLHVQCEKCTGEKERHLREATAGAVECEAVAKDGLQGRRGQHSVQPIFS